MRKLPVYLLVDVSGSMSGEPIQAVNNGLQLLVSALRKDPHALETAWLSVITFSNSAQQVVPLTDLQTFQVPTLSASGCTALGEALQLVCAKARDEVQKGDPASGQKGDWRPMVFLMTDGVPTDDPTAGIQEFASLQWGAKVSLAAGPGADRDLLEKITPECVLQIDTADQASIGAFFQWVSASVQSSSKSVHEAGGQPEGLDQMPPPPSIVQVT